MGQARTTEAFFYKTVAKHQEGDTRGAEKDYRKILRHAPENVATLINLGILLKERGELKRAFDLFSDAETAQLAREHRHHIVIDLLDPAELKEVRQDAIAILGILPTPCGGVVE